MAAINIFKEAPYVVFDNNDVPRIVKASRLHKLALGEFDLEEALAGVLVDDKNITRSSTYSAVLPGIPYTLNPNEPKRELVAVASAYIALEHTIVYKVCTHWVLTKSLPPVEAAEHLERHWEELHQITQATYPAGLNTKLVLCPMVELITRVNNQFVQNSYFPCLTLKDRFSPVFEILDLY